jgi:hypothetical protein
MIIRGKMGPYAFFDVERLFSWRGGYLEQTPKQNVQI